MNCHSELDYSRYIDGEIAPDARPSLEAHLAACAECRRLVDGLRAEAAQIRLVITEAPPASESVARLASNISISVCLVLGLEWALVGPQEWTWVAAVPAAMGALADARVAIPMLILALALLSLAVASRVVRRRAAWPIVLLIVFGLIAPDSAQGMTRRTGRVALVARDEVIRDSVFAGAETVRIDGTVDGDLFAMGRRIEVTGTVRGRIFATGEFIRIDGQVGRVHAFGRQILLQGHAAGTVYGWGERVIVAPAAQLDGECLAAGRILIVAGDVRRHVTTAGNNLVVPASARLRGGLSAYLASREAAQIDPAAVIDGARTIRGHDRLSATYLIGELVWLLIAFVCGWWLWRSRPHLAACCASALQSWWRSLAWGIGSVTLLALGCIVLAVTIIGLPLALAAAVTLATMWFLAKVIVAGHIAELLGERWASSFPTRLVAALIAIGLLSWPGYGVGTAVSLSLSIAGSGALARTVWGRSLAR